MALSKIIRTLIKLLFFAISFNLLSDIRSDPKPIKLGKYHDSEGSLFSYNNDLIHIFRSTTENGNHVSNDGYIAMRKSLNGGVSWSDPVIISEGYYDHRNARASVLDDGRIIVFFRIYDADTAQPKSLNYTYSDANHENWTAPKSIFNELNLEAFYEAWIDNITQVENELYLTLHSVGYISVFKSKLTLESLDFEKIYSNDFRSDSELRFLDEPELIFSENNEVFIIFRDEQYPNNKEMGFYLMKSLDGARSFSTPVRTNICNYSYAKPVAPHGYIQEGKIHIFGSYRMMEESTSKDDGWCYFEEEIGTNVYDNFKENLNVGRPFQNPHMFYGYLISEKITNSKRLFIFTESFRDDDGDENADFYQFILSTKDKIINLEEFNSIISEGIVFEVTSQAKGQITTPSNHIKQRFVAKRSQDEMFNAPYIIKPYLSITDEKKVTWLSDVLEKTIDIVLSDELITPENKNALDLNSDEKITLSDVIILYQKINNLIDNDIMSFKINGEKVRNEFMVTLNNVDLNLDGTVIGNFDNSFQLSDRDFCPELIGSNLIILDQSNDFRSSLITFNPNNDEAILNMSKITNLFFDRLEATIEYQGNLGNNPFELYRTSFTFLEPLACNKSRDYIVIVLNADIDNDGIDNLNDNDMDGDGWHNELDQFFWDKLEHLDTDSDGIGNNSDDDIDGDGILNSDDDDIDGDGILNSDDEDDSNPYK